mmetsp:Transcript_127499/g.302966  ORF Transcript_127499/g.302966 Transcript_127499/m.302966 type:complete len:263 (+) Transcript_127499:1936-2724(+)
MLGRVHQKLLQLLHVRLAVETAAAALLGDLCDLVGELLGSVLLGLVLSFALAASGCATAVLALLFLSVSLLLLLRLVLCLLGFCPLGLSLTLGKLLRRDEPSEHLPLTNQILVSITIRRVGLSRAVEAIGVGIRACAAGVRGVIGVTVRVRARGIRAGGAGGGVRGAAPLAFVAGLARRVTGFGLLVRLEVIRIVPQLLQVIGKGLVALLHLGTQGVERLVLALLELDSLLLLFLVLLLYIVLQATDGLDEGFGRTAVLLHL